jgi:hypothetical protein
VNAGRKEALLSSQPSSTLIGTNHGHFEVSCRQYIEHAIILALASVSAGLLRSKLFDRRLREATTQHVGRFGRREEGALLWVSRETSRLEERGIGVMDLPFLAKSIHLGHDSFTITRQLYAIREIAHKARTVTKVLAHPLHNQDRDKVLVGLDLDKLVELCIQFTLSTLLPVGIYSTACLESMMSRHYKGSRLSSSFFSSSAKLA